MTFRPSVIKNESYVLIHGVKHKHHVNGWGLVAETAEVEDSVFVDMSCRVSGKAVIKGNVRLRDATEVDGSVCLSGTLVLSNTRVQGEVELSGDALISGATLIPGIF